MISCLVAAWLRNSFLFQRIQKNPRHYGLGKASGQTWQSRLDELVDSSIRDLQKSDLVTNSGIGDDFTSTEYGDIMSKVRSMSSISLYGAAYAFVQYYIRLSTVISVTCEELNLLSLLLDEIDTQAVRQIQPPRDCEFMSLDHRYTNPWHINPA